MIANHDAPWFRYHQEKPFPTLAEVAARYEGQIDHARRILEPAGFHVVLGKFGLCNWVLGSYELSLRDQRAILYRPSEEHLLDVTRAIRESAHALFARAVCAFRKNGYQTFVMEDTDPLCRGPPRRLRY